MTLNLLLTIIELLGMLFIIAKLVLFYIYKSRWDSIRNLLYYSHMNIALTNTPTKKKMKGVQNALSFAILVFILFYFGLLFLIKSIQ